MNALKCLADLPEPALHAKRGAKGAPLRPGEDSVIQLPQQLRLKHGGLHGIRQRLQELLH